MRMYISTYVDVVLCGVYVRMYMHSDSVSRGRYVLQWIVVN